MAIRTEALSTRINPKIKYLTELLARERGLSLSRFVESILEATLNNSLPHLQNEGLWDEDPAKRLFLLVTARPDLMNDAERGLWRRILSTPNLLAKNGAVDRKKLCANWPAVVGKDEV